MLSRLTDGGMPADITFLTRFISYCPTALLSKFIQLSCNRRFCHSTYSLQPKHPPSAQHLMVNDALPHQIITGSLVVKPNVAELTKDSVEFVDGSTVNNVDAVIFFHRIRHEVPLHGNRARNPV